MIEAVNNDFFLLVNQHKSASLTSFLGSVAYVIPTFREKFSLFFFFTKSYALSRALSLDLASRRVARSDILAFFSHFRKKKKDRVFFS